MTTPPRSLVSTRPAPTRLAPVLLVALCCLLPCASDVVAQQGRATIEYMWSGGVTQNSARVSARVSADGLKVRILLSDNTEFTTPKYSEPSETDWLKNGRSVLAKFDGLKPDTRYYYAVEIDGTTDTARRGTFKTFPDAPASFRVVFGSCASTGSESRVFDTIREHQPSVFLHLGDFHYENISKDAPDEFREAFGRVLSSSTQSHLYRSVPIDYVWDDHDWGPNDSDRTNPARRSAHRVYRETVPHYDLDGDESPLYHAFTIGRARFIVLDTRSARDPRRSVRPSMLGAKQKQWFLEQLADASKKYPLVFLVQSVPWIAETGKTADGWAPYCEERREIAKQIDSLDLTQRLVMLSGDAHMLALDDGRHSNFATDGCGFSRIAKGFPVFQAASFDRRGSIKGGPYAPGFPQPGRGHFGLVTVSDEGGDTIRVQLSGRDLRDQELMGLDLRIPVVVR
jgi:alkaline phosphatase D